MLPPSFIHAPTNRGLSRYSDGRKCRPDRLSEALAGTKLIEYIDAKGITVPSRPPDPADGQRVENTRHSPTVRAFTLALADAVTQARQRGHTPVVCGSGYPMLPGCGLALAREGRHALVFLDAHHDYRHPGNSNAFDVASADLAIVTGRGPEQLTNIENHHPYFHEEDVLTFGFRYPDSTESWMLAEVRDTAIGLTTLEDGRAIGMEWVGRALADSYEKQPALEGFWIHLDADVLDPTVLRAVDHPVPGGLQPEELTTLLTRLLRSPRFRGMDVTVPDPELDADGASQRCLTDILRRAFQAAA